jgi:hypothetical protein
MKDAEEANIRTPASNDFDVRDIARIYIPPCDDVGLEW